MTTECEFKAALCWKETGCGCDVIKVAPNTELLVYEGISIGSEHSNLHVIIPATSSLSWATTPNGISVGKIISFGPGASNITIDGGGTLTSEFIACAEWDSSGCTSPPGGVLDICNAITMSTNGGGNITIQNLTITNVAFAIEMNWGESRNITNATNATPIVITTQDDHFWETGDSVNICGVQGNTAANGTWTITVTATNKFRLNGSAGNGTYVAGADLASLVKPPTTNVTFKDLTIQNVQGYGAFLGHMQDVTIENCHVQNAYGQHGFRTYSDNVTILDSSANNTHSSGFWMVNGNHLTVDGFTSTGQRTDLGPNAHATYPCAAEERALDADIRNLDINGTSQADIKMSVSLGTLGAWFDGITNDLTDNTLALAEIVIHRPLNKIYWGTLNHGADPNLLNPNFHSCIGVAIGPRACKYDVVANGAVDVDDLLLIINSWGPCSSTEVLCTNPAVTVHICTADVVPYNGDAVIDVDDLLAIINSWGPCDAPTHEAPESISECESTCAARFPGGGNDYSECMERCVISLCERGILSAQDCP